MPVVTSAFLTKELLAPITTALTDNLTVLLPVGIGIFAVMIGVKLIPSIIYRFM